MIPYDPMALHVLWYQNWRKHIKDAKANPTQQDGYCRSACIAQMEFLCELAILINQEKSQ